MATRLSTSDQPRRRSTNPHTPLAWSAFAIRARSRRGSPAEDRRCFSPPFCRARSVAVGLAFGLWVSSLSPPLREPELHRPCGPPRMQQSVGISRFRPGVSGLTRLSQMHSYIPGGRYGAESSGWRHDSGSRCITCCRECEQLPWLDPRVYASLLTPSAGSGSLTDAVCKVI